MEGITKTRDDVKRENSAETVLKNTRKRPHEKSRLKWGDGVNKDIEQLKPKVN